MCSSTLLIAAEARAGEVPVADVDGLLAAIQAAKAGDTIVLAPGEYEVHQSKITCEAVGTEAAPIVVQAAELGTALLRFDAVEGFHVRGAFWEFRNLDIEGICAADSDCEHAFHVTGDAESTHIHHNRMHGFNAMIKGNGEPIGPGDAYVWPDDVVIEYNEFYNDAPRDTANPVTPIDVVGGHRWVLRGNYIHDHAKGGGDGISYAAFLKGHAQDGLIERNLVVCEQLHAGQVRLGLSLGGGGSGPDKICEMGSCKPEHDRGVMRNNLIVNCPTDVGIYVNAGANSTIVNNTLVNTAGIDMRFPETTGVVHNNLLAGKIRDRDGAVTTRMNNLEEVAPGDFAAWFADPGALDFTLVDGAALVDKALALPEVTNDYCGNERDDGAPDIGAIEFDGDGCVGGLPAPGGDEGGESGTGTGEPGDETGNESSGDTGVDPSAGDSTGAPDPTDTLVPTEGQGSTVDAPTQAGGETEAGASEGGASEGGATEGAQDGEGGCGCRSDGQGGAAALLGLALLGLRPRRRAATR